MNLLQQFLNILTSQNPAPSRATVKNYKADISRFITWYTAQFETFLPAGVTPQIIDQYKAAMTSQTDTEEGLSLRSAERHLSSLRKFFTFLKLKGEIQVSPFEIMKKVQSETNTDPYKLQEFKNHLYNSNISDLTTKNYVNDVKQFFSWADKVLKLEELHEVSQRDIFKHIDVPLLEEYKDRLQHEAALSPVSINRKLSSLRKYLAFAMKEGILRTQDLSVMNQESGIKNQEPELNQDHDSYFMTHDSISNNNNEHQHSSEEETALATPRYSKIPPLRLIQRMGHLASLGFEAALIAPLTALALKLHIIKWHLTGASVFTPVIGSKAKQSFFHGIATSLNAPRNDTMGIISLKNFKKSFFAPHAISLDGLPWHKKAIHHVRYTRPKWYKRYHENPITHYFHFAILVIVMTALGVGMYQAFVTDSTPVKAAPVSPPRILSFQGRLTDANDNPITAGTNLRFGIYNDPTASGAALLWEEVDPVTPDTDGIFSLLLGNNTVIPQSLFGDNAALWLAITVESTDELAPRQQIATVPYATNSELLQGMAPITQVGAGTTNVVLALNSSGNLAIGGAAAPIFQATGGSFTLQGTTTVISTVTGSGGNVIVNPDGYGQIDLQKTIQNSTNNNNIPSAAGSVEVDDLFSVLATSSGQSAVTINQDGNGPILSASSSGTQRFTIANNGQLTIPLYNAAGGILYGNASGVISQTGVGTAAQCLIGGATPSFASCPGGTSDVFWGQANGALYANNATVDLLVGGQSTASAKFAVLNVNSGTPTASVSAGAAGAAFLTATGSLSTTARQTLTIGNSSTFNTTGNVEINPNGTGNVGIGNAAASNARLYNYRLNSSADTGTQYGANFYYERSTAKGDGNTDYGLTSDYRYSGGTGNAVNGNYGGFFTSKYAANVTNASMVMTGFRSTAEIASGSTGTVSELRGAQFDAQVRSGSASTIQGFYTWVGVNPEGGSGATGTATNAYGIRIAGFESDPAVSGGTGTLTNRYGIHMVNIGDNATSYAIYSQGGKSYFAGNIGIGTTAPAGLLHVTGATTGNALAIFNQTTSNADLLTASASGTPKFTVGNTGSITSAAYTNAGGVVYTSTTGLLGQTAVGTASQCLLGGAVPVFGSCGTGTDAFWDQINGALFPKNSTVDLLIGGTATTSAKFAVLNMNSGTPVASVSAGVAGGVYLSATGTLATTAKQTLTLGDSTTTGNIIMNPGGNVGIGATTVPLAKLDLTGSASLSANISMRGAGTAHTFKILDAGSFFFQVSPGGDVGAATVMSISANGNIGINSVSTATTTIGNSTGQVNLVGNRINANSYLTDTAGGAAQGNSIIANLNPAGASASQFRGNVMQAIVTTGNTQDFSDSIIANYSETRHLGSGSINIATGTRSLGLTLPSAAVNFGTINNVYGMEVYSVNEFASSAITGTVTTATGAIIKAAVKANSSWTLTNQIGLDVEAMTQAATSNIGVRIGSAGTYSLQLSGTGGTAASGITFGTDTNLYRSAANVLRTDDSLIVGGSTLTISNYTTNGGVLYTNGSGVVAQTGAGTAAQCLLGGTTPGFGSCGGGYWDQQNGSLYPINSTVDLLIGGQSTASAKFAFINVNSGSPTATISGNLSLVVPTGVSPSTLLNIYNGGAFDLRQSVGGDAGLTSRLYVHRGGNVGIGTTAPTYGLLSVNGNIGIGGGAGGTTGQGITFPSHTDDSARIFGEYTGTESKLVLRIADDSPQDAIVLRVNNWAVGDKEQLTTNFNGVRIYDALNAGLMDYSAIVGYNRFGNATTSHSLATSSALLVSGLFEVDGNSFFDGASNSFSGNVGIGVAASTNRLEVVGSTYLNGQVIQSSNYNIGVDQPTAPFYISRDGGTTQAGKLWASDTKFILQSVQDETAEAGNYGSMLFLIDTKNVFAGGQSDFTFATNSASGSALMYIGQFGNVGIGTSAPTGKFHVTGSTTGNALAIFNQTTSNADLLTASASGTPKFTVGNTGSITSAAYTTPGGLLYGTATGLISQTGAGTAAQCLLGGTTPGFGSCGNGYWDQQNGALYPVNSTVDLLVGGQSTASAKFAFINVNSGNPTASISGNLAITSPTGANPATTYKVLNGGTLNFQRSVGGDTGLTSSLFIDRAGNVGIGLTNPSNRLDVWKTADQDTSGYTYATRSTLSYTGTADQVGDYRHAGGYFGSSINGSYNVTSGFEQFTGIMGVNTFNMTGNPTVSSTYGVYSALNLSATNNSTLTTYNGVNVNGYAPSGHTTAITNLNWISAGYFNNSGTLTITNQKGLYIPAMVAATVNYGIHVVAQTTGTSDYGIAVEAADTQTLWVSSNANNTTAAAGIAFGSSRDTNLYRSAANTLMTDDSFTAAGSAITFSTFTSNGGPLYTNGSGVLAQTTAGTTAQCLTGGTTPSFSTCNIGPNDFLWAQSNGALYPNNSTVDLLIGGQSTTSAKFAVLNLNGVGTPTATVSGNLIVMHNNLTGGNVGIGITNPTASLHFGNKVTDTDDIIGPASQEFDIRAGTAQLMDLQSGVEGQIRMFVDTGSGSELPLRIYDYASSSNDYLSLSHTGSYARIRNSNSADAIVLQDGGGNVGIGNTDPRAALDVTGSASLSANMLLRGSGTSHFLKLLDGGSFTVRTSNGGDGAENTATRFQIANEANNGNVGIGVGASSTAKTSMYTSIGSSATNWQRTLNLQLDITGTTNGQAFVGEGMTVQTTAAHTSGNIGTIRAVDNQVYFGSQMANQSDVGITNMYSFYTSNNVNGTNTKGTVTYAVNMLLDSVYYSSAITPLVTFTNKYGLQVNNQGASNPANGFDIGFATGVAIANTSGAQKNINLLIGATASPSASQNYSIYNQSSYDNYMAGNVGIGLTNPTYKLDVSGTTRISGVLTFSNYTNNGGIFYANGSGVVSQTAAGTSGQCLVGGATPSFGSCGNGYWDQQNGALYPVNSTVDFLIGGQSTASAKFAVLNVNSGTPVASVSSGVSGTSMYMTADGTLATAKRQTLTIGNSSTYNTTGNVLINPNGTGNVGIGTTAPTQKLHVNGGNVLISNAGTDTFLYIDSTTGGSVGRIAATGSLHLTPQSGSHVIVPSGNVGIGITAPLALLHVGTGGTPTIAATGDGYFQNDLEVDGLTNFAGAATFGSTTTLNSLTYTWPGSQSSDYVLSTNGSGTLSWVNVSGLSGANYWDQNNGILYPRNTTVDLLIGGTSTASAKFAFINVNSGNPTASISGNLAIAAPSGANPATTYSVLNGGTINFQRSAGGNAGLTSSMFINRDGNVGIGTTTTYAKLEVQNSGGTAAIFEGTDQTGSGTSAIHINAAGGTPTNGNQKTIFFSDNLSSFARIDARTGEMMRLGTIGSLPLHFITNGATSYRMTVAADGNVGIGTTTPTSATLQVVGTTNFSGAATFGSTTTLNSLTYTWPASQTTGYVLQTNGSGTLSWADPSVLVAGSNYWIQANGALYPKNSTVDFFIGGQASSSAKFAVLNMNTGTPVASVSAGTGTTGGAYLTAAGNLATTNMQTLRLGDSTTTGNITLLSAGNIGLGTANQPKELVQIADTWTYHNGGFKLFSFNSYFSSSWKYLNTEAPFQIEDDTTNDVYHFKTAANGSTDATITFNYPMAINPANGFVAMGRALAVASNNFPRAQLDITGSASVSAHMSLGGASTAHTFNILDGGTLNFLTSRGGDAGVGTSRLFISSDGNAGNVGIGHTLPTAKIDTRLSSSLTTSTTETTANTYLFFTPGSAPSSVGKFASLTSAQSFGSVDMANATLYSGYFQPYNANTDTAGAGVNHVGAYADAYNASTGKVGNMTGVLARINNQSTGTITNAYGIRTGDFTNTVGGTIANTFGFYIGDVTPTTGTQTNQAYGLYQADTGARNYFGGNVGIGITAPLALLHVGTGGTPSIASTGDGYFQNDLEVDGTTNFAGAATFGSTTTLNSLTYTWPASQTSGYVLSTNGSGTLSWSDPGALSGVNYWNIANGTLYPKNSTLDLLIGGVSTASAKFAFINVNSGNPTASISGNLAIAAPSGANPATTYSVLNGGTMNFQRSPGGDAGLTSSMFINRDGNVGIGTTDPLYKLDIVQNTASTALFGAIRNTSNTSGAHAIQYITSGGSSGGNAYTNYSVGPQNWAVGIDNANGDAFTIGSAGSIGAATDRLTILTSGNVGIGTTAPVAQFDLRTTLGTAPAASISARSNSFAGLVVDNAGTGDIFTASASGLTRFVIKNNGSVGINTSTPANALDVYSYPGVGGAVAASTFKDIAGTYFLTPAAVGTSMVVAGNVGIGTTAPITQLNLSGNGQSTTAFADAGDLGGALLLNDTEQAGGSGGALLFGGLSTNTKWFGGIKGVLTNGATNSIGDLAFMTRNAIADTALTERMRILASGNIGIGITAPQATLHIIHASNSTGGILLGSSVTDATNKSGRIKSMPYLNAEAPVTMLLADNRTGSNALHIGGGSASEASLTHVGIWTASTTGVLGGFERFSVDNTGNVGIGIVSPTALLHVVGTEPATVGTTPGTAAVPALTVAGAAGGPTTHATGTGGAGSGISMVSGAGGSASGATSIVGGTGGAFAITAGAGGNVSTGTTRQGGTGGSITLTAGAGGSGNSAATAIGGNISILGGGNSGTTGNSNGGNVYIAGGPLSNAGTNGNVLLGITSAGTIIGNVGIGTTAPTAALQVDSTIALSGSAQFGSVFGGNITGNQSSETVYSMYLNNRYSSASGNTLGQLIGGYFQPYNASTGTISTLIGTQGMPVNNSTGTVTDMRGVNAVPDNASTGTVGNMFGLFVQPINLGTISNNLYGVYVAAAAGAGSVSGQKYAFISEAGAGNVGIGTTAPTTAKLNLVMSSLTGSSHSTLGLSTTINPTGGATQYGVNNTITNAPTSVANAAVGYLASVTDNTTLGNILYGYQASLASTNNAAKLLIGFRADVSTSSTTADSAWGGYFGSTNTGNVNKQPIGVYAAATTNNTSANNNPTGLFAAASSTGVLTGSTRHDLWGVMTQPRGQGASTGGIIATKGLYGYPVNENFAPSTGNTTISETMGLYVTGYNVAASNCAANCTVNHFGVYIENATTSTNGTSTQYGLYVGAQSGSDTNYQLYSNGTAPSYFAGNIGIGTISPTLGNLQLSSGLGSTLGVVYSAQSSSQSISYVAQNSSGNVAWFGMAREGYVGSGLMTALIGVESGTSHDETNYKIAITSNGNVGFGVLAPGSDIVLQQKSDSQASGGFRLYNTAASGGNYGVVLEGSDEQLYLFTNNNNQYCWVTTGGAMSCSSDSRLKENIAPITTSALDILSQLKPSTFDRINGGTNEAGFIAQEVESILPGAINMDINGYYGLKYDHFIPYIVKGIQELNGEVNTNNTNQTLGLATTNTQVTTLANTMTNLTLTDMGALAIAATPDPLRYQISKNGTVFTQIAALSEAWIANLKVGVLNVEKINIAGESLKDYIVRVVEESGFMNQESGITAPIANIDRVYTNALSPLPSGNGVVTVDGNLAVSGNATISGKLTAQNIESNDASFSGTLRAKNIIADNIVGLQATIATMAANTITNITNVYNSNPTESIYADKEATPSALIAALGTLPSGVNMASYSGSLASIDTVVANFGTFNQGLLALGPSSMTDVSVTGQFSVGSIYMNDNSINTLGADLELQPLSQGGIRIMGGKISIDTNGDIQFGEQATFAKNVRVNGKLIGRVISPIPDEDLVIELGTDGLGDSRFLVKNASGSAVFQVNQAGDITASGSASIAKLKFNLIKPAMATGAGDLIAFDSAGVATISATRSEITIHNAQVTDKSLIYITPIGTPSATGTYLMRQVAGKSFTVGGGSNTIFNWLIIN